MARKKTILLAEFTPGQIVDLIDDYATIVCEVEELANVGITDVRLPFLNDDSERQAILAKLDAAGDLSIRISYAGNLNVAVRQASDNDGRPDDTHYLLVLRRPATWLATITGAQLDWDTQKWYFVIWVDDARERIRFASEPIYAAEEDANAAAGKWLLRRNR